MLSSSSRRPSAMSQLMSIPGASLTSQLIQSFGGSVPDPQLRRLTSPSGMSAHRPQLLDQATEDPARVEVLLGDLARGASVMPGVVAHRFHRGDRLLQSGVGEQALSRRQVAAEAGLLRDHWLAAGQVAGAAIAEPAAAGIDVHRF